MNKIIFFTILINTYKTCVEFKMLHFDLSNSSFKIPFDSKITKEISNYNHRNCTIPNLIYKNCYYKTIYWKKRKNYYIKYIHLVKEEDKNKIIDIGNSLSFCDYDGDIYSIQILRPYSIYKQVKLDLIKKKPQTNSQKLVSLAEINKKNFKNVSKNKENDKNAKNTKNTENNKNNKNAENTEKAKNNKNAKKKGNTKKTKDELNEKLNIKNSKEIKNIHNKKIINLPNIVNLKLLPVNGGYNIKLNNNYNGVAIKKYNKSKKIKKPKKKIKIFKIENDTKKDFINALNNLYFPKMDLDPLEIPLNSILDINDFDTNSVILNLFPNIKDQMLKIKNNFRYTLLYFVKLDYKTADNKNVYMPVYFLNFIKNSIKDIIKKPKKSKIAKNDKKATKKKENKKKENKKIIKKKDNSKAFDVYNEISNNKTVSLAEKSIKIEKNQKKVKIEASGNKEIKTTENKNSKSSDNKKEKTNKKLNKKKITSKKLNKEKITSKKLNKEEITSKNLNKIESKKINQNKELLIRVLTIEDNKIKSVKTKNAKTIPEKINKVIVDKNYLKLPTDDLINSFLSIKAYFEMLKSKKIDSYVKYNKINL